MTGHLTHFLVVSGTVWVVSGSLVGLWYNLVVFGTVLVVSGTVWWSLVQFG